VSEDHLRFLLQIKSGLVNGLGSAIGGTAIGAALGATRYLLSLISSYSVWLMFSRRDIDERSLLSSAGKLLESGTGDAVSI